MKRVMDLLIAIPGVLVAAPIMLVIATTVRLSLGAPVLFRQQRPGRHGRPFLMYKFRTMRAAAQAGEDDGARLSALGRFLRRTSLDELPELWNVIRGDMSLVGPRPLLPEYLPLYNARQARRHEVRPGITGWAQVNGRNAVSWPERFEMDVWYVDNQSLLLDLKILILTIRKVLSGEGISQAGRATMEPFRGNTP